MIVINYLDNQVLLSIRPNSKRVEKFLSLGKKLRQMTLKKTPYKII